LDGFPNGHEFEPDRMLDDRREDIKYRDMFATFGSGPHLCVGREYAVNHLTVFLAELARTCEWTRKITDKSEDFVYLPTVCPGDCLVAIKWREV